MKYYFFILALFLFAPTQIFSQNLKGRVVDSKGQPVVGSTVYISKINQGLLCNENGEFQTTLSKGNYLLEARCLGYKSATQNIEVGNSLIEVDLVLKENPFELKEVVVSSKEDPAYAIMRKAIEKAPYYAKSVESYTANVYIKGSGELKSIGKMIDRLGRTEDGLRLSDFKEKTFLQESDNEIIFTSPDIYKQTVKAFSSSMPDDLNPKDAMGLMKSSLYNPEFGGFVSPLNPKAFSYYRFRYEGFMEEGGLIINKVKIEPKLKDPLLIHGYIYIADDSWHIVSAEISSDIMGVKRTDNVMYQEVGDGAYLPITVLTNMDINIGFVGIEAVFDYYTSSKYTDVKVRSEQEIASEKEREKNKKRDFEITWNKNYEIVSDSLAMKRDSSYWNQIRSLPLDNKEILSYARKDSMQQHVDSMRSKFHNSKFSYGDILSGGKIGGDSTRFAFKFDGLLQAFPGYNFVDGIKMGQSFELSAKFKKHNQLKIAPYVYYADARNKLLAGGDIILTYDSIRLGKLKVSGGVTSEDFNPNGISKLNNSLISLITAKNKNFFYQKNFIAISNKIDLANGLVLNVGFDIAKRYGLSNHTDYTWGRKRHIKENILPNDRFDRTAYSVSLFYAPFAYYRIRDGKKSYANVTSPIFYIGYEEAVSTKQRDNSIFRRIDIGIKQSVKTDYFSNFGYLIAGGSFLGRKDKIHFADYKHFNTSNTAFSLKAPFEPFMLLDNYEASTNDYWLGAQANYMSRYILLKRLPFLQGKMFTESFHFKTLYTPQFKTYTEFGYSLNLTRMVNLGVFTSFKKTKYEAVGVRFAVDWDLMKSMK